MSQGSSKTSGALVLAAAAAAVVALALAAAAALAFAAARNAVVPAPSGLEAVALQKAE